MTADSWLCADWANWEHCFGESWVGFPEFQHPKPRDLCSYCWVGLHTRSLPPSLNRSQLASRCGCQSRLSLIWRQRKPSELHDARIHTQTHTLPDLPPHGARIWCEHSLALISCRTLMLIVVFLSPRCRRQSLCSNLPSQFLSSDCDASKMLWIHSRPAYRLPLSLCAAPRRLRA